MKTKKNEELTFGGFITAAYQIWGADQAEKMVRLAFIARLVMFRKQPHFLAFSAKGRSA